MIVDTSLPGTAGQLTPWNVVHKLKGANARLQSQGYSEDGQPFSAAALVEHRKRSIYPTVSLAFSAKVLNSTIICNSGWGQFPGLGIKRSFVQLISAYNQVRGSVHKQA